MLLSQQLLEEEEGPSSPHVYADSRGYWTIARGTLVDSRIICEGLCQEALAAQDNYTLQQAAALASGLLGYTQCNAVRQAVCVSMCFQLGGLSGWPGFKAALSIGDYNTAADNMLYKVVSEKTPSDWYLQTPTRCARAAYMMRTGAWLNYGVEPPIS